MPQGYPVPPGPQSYTSPPPGLSAAQMQMSSPPNQAYAPPAQAYAALGAPPTTVQAHALQAVLQLKPQPLP